MTGSRNLRCGARRNQTASSQPSEHRALNNSDFSPESGNRYDPKAIRAKQPKKKTTMKNKSVLKLIKVNGLLKVTP